MKNIGRRAIYPMAGVVFVALVIGILLAETARTPCAQVAYGDVHLDEAIVSDYVPESCTIFTSSYGDTVLFGNNEDWINPNTYYWVVPSSGGDYGAVYYRCVEDHFETFEQVYEERFERQYGFFRPYVRKVI